MSIEYEVPGVRPVSVYEFVLGGRAWFSPFDAATAKESIVLSLSVHDTVIEVEVTLVILVTGGVGSGILVLVVTVFPLT